MPRSMQRIARYLATGGVGLVVNLGSYRLLVERFALPYLPGSMIAVSLSTITGFILQKYWTFAEHDHSRVPRQFLLYASLACWNLCLNTAIVFVLVEYTGAHYLFAQACGAGIVALSSFFIYRYYIFAPASPDQSDASGARRQS